MDNLTSQLAIIEHQEMQYFKKYYPNIMVNCASWTLPKAHCYSLGPQSWVRIIAETKEELEQLQKFKDMHPDKMWVVGC
jgi:hypothetical protein